MKSPRTLALTVGLCAALAACGSQNESTPAAQAPATTPAASPTSSIATATPTTQSPETGADGSSSSATAAPGGGNDRRTTGTEEPTAAATASASRTNSARSSEQSTGVAQKDVGDYGDAAVNAWKAGDREALSKYVSPSVSTDLKSAPPKGELTRVGCEGDMCSYITKDERRVTLTFDENKVKQGRSGGITAVKVD